MYIVSNSFNCFSITSLQAFTAPSRQDLRHAWIAQIQISS